jgi:DNA-binding HxlR family transcriptional regulator
MRTYAQYCPVVRAVEVLGDRWTLLIVRDMLIGATRFNELSRGLPGLSRALLSRRLRQLVNAGLVRRTADGYALTQAGADLPTLYRMWEGEIEFRQALRTGDINLTGARWIVRGLPDWLQLSEVAPIVRAARAT